MKEAIARITLVLLSIGIAILIIEMTLKASCSDANFSVRHEIYGFLYRANQAGWRCGEEYQVSVRINSKGFRDQEYSYEKPVNTQRILVLGDSFTAAMQVPQNMTFHEQLETLLNQSEQKTHYEVISVGVERWGTGQELLFFSHEGYKYNPRIVLLMFYIGNDIFDNTSNFPDPEQRRPYYTWNKTKNKLEPVIYIDKKEEKRTLDSIKWLLSQSSLYWMARTRLMRSPTASKLLIQMGVMSDFSPFYNIYKSDYSPNLEEGWDITLALLKQLRDQVEQQNAVFAVVIVPQVVQLREDLWRLAREIYMGGVRRADPNRPDNILLPFLIEENIPYLHLLARFREQPASIKEALYLAHDGHWSIEGHRLVSRLIHTYLTEELSLFQHGSTKN